MVNNSEKTATRRRGKGKPFPKGVSGNPSGRPKDEESWSGVIRLMQNYTADEIAEMLGGRTTDLGRAYLQMPKNVQMKYLMTLRAMADFMFEPTSSLWDKIMERSDGKVAQPIEANVNMTWSNFVNSDEETDTK